MPYSAEQIADFTESLKEWTAREGCLSENLVIRSYKNERSRTLAAQGAARRLSTLIRCIEQVYSLLPPDALSPKRINIDDAAIWLQAFMINTYGVIDNFARVWVWEADIQHKGRPLAPMKIGLTPDNTIVRASLSAEMQSYLTTTNGWFGYLENYRHALAHRVPLYIPPRSMDDNAAKKWKQLEAESVEALKVRDWDRYKQLRGQQSQLGTYQPWMMHSFGPHENDGNPVLFHPQMICDLATVVEIGENLLRELDALS
ncbi:hypothetical protein ACQKGC_24235 [Allorhizobium pseudoryzae]|uniref:hypothetical protein n=1 Tax=Allorhizobium pseudoryzae TaxID=379684 RepID=UPI003D08F8A6